MDLGLQWKLLIEPAVGLSNKWPHSGLAVLLGVTGLFVYINTYLGLRLDGHN